MKRIAALACLCLVAAPSILAARPPDGSKHVLGRYLRRNATFDLKNDTLVAYRIDAPVVVSFDPWPAEVFLAADGKTTGQAFLDKATRAFKGKAPTELPDVVVQAIDDLVNEHVLVLADAPSDLPYYFSAPKSQLDADKLRAAMERDHVGGTAGKH
jgi:hypothetical protein